MKIFNNILTLLITVISFMGCSNDPSDPLDPCTNQNIVGFSINDYPTTSTIRLADLTFGEFDGNIGLVNIVPPTANVTIGRLSPSDANTYNPTNGLYSFIMRATDHIVNLDTNTGIISEVSLPPTSSGYTGVNGYNGFVYSPTSGFYYTIEVNNATITLHEFSNITAGLVVFNNSKVIYSGVDAADAVMFQSHFSLVTDSNGTLFILTNKDIISQDLMNFPTAIPIYHSMGIPFNSVDRLTGLEYDATNNRLLFLVSAFGSNFLSLDQTILPLGTIVNSSIVKNLSSNFSDFNLDFHSTVLACDGTYIIANHIDNQVPIETRSIAIETNGTITTNTFNTHIFGLQNKI
jgi:hypothetical protein